MTNSVECSSIWFNDYPAKNVNALTLKSETDVMGVLSLFDHDPVVSSMSTKTDIGYLYRRNHKSILR
jgi:hypothetical protein